MESNVYSEKVYLENLDIYALYDPKLAIKIGNLPSSNLEFCYTHLGELNLKLEHQGKTFYYHDMDGALLEAREWFQGIPTNYNHIFLYGLGLGYYYLTAKAWLKKSPNNYLFILEDDLNVINKFLETTLATEILNHPQVFVHYLESSKDIKEGLFKSLTIIVKGFLRQKFYLSSSKLYSKYNEFMILQIKEMLFQMTSWHVVRAGEIVSSVDLIFGNFYHNTLRQFMTYDGNKLKNAFFDMPAVICGAGPSIVNDIPFLKEIQNKALIIASGTGMNVLNHYGIFPHFGTAIDPTDSQTTRIKTNSAYEIPFVYRTRFNKDSFDFLHGPKLLISGKSGYSISEWFIPRLSKSQDLVEDFKTGISSTNFAMELAKHLGCNPMILLGTDLAYTDASRYPPMISAHPIDTKNAKNEIERKSEILLAGKGNNGNEVTSKIDWITESRLMTQFQRNNSDKPIFNGSLEGLEIKRIPYKSFHDFTREFMDHQYDMDGWVHAEYIQSDLEETKDICLKTYEEWHESIKKAIRLYEELQNEILELIKMPLDIELVPPYNSKIALLETELYEEPAFKYFVVDLMEIIDDTAIRQKIAYRCHTSHLTQREKNLKRLEIDINYIYFIIGHLEKADKLIHRTFINFINDENSINKFTEENVIETSSLVENYKIENGRLIILDEILKIDINIPFAPKLIPNEGLDKSEDKKILLEQFISINKILEGQYLRFYENGHLKSESYYHKGMLHGPSTWFNEQGLLLSKTWFVNGLKQGKSSFYYKNGNIHSLRLYRDGKKEGEHTYFYKNGRIKSKLRYQNDLFHGVIELFYENGIKKRELNYHEGLLEGQEKYWDKNGTLIWEAEYKKGLADGKAKLWNSNGTLIREYTYFSDHKHFNLKEWNELGKLIFEENNISENLKESAEKKRQNISNALDKLNRELFMIQTLTKEEKKRLFY